MFTYHGFRYVEISGFPGSPDKEALTGMVFHSDNPWIGSFECSEDLVNKIYKNITWAQRGNLMSVPTDCPQRDERLGWMGDAQIFSPTACYNMDMTRFFEKWMHDITDCQDPSGYVYDVNPAIVVTGPAKPGWGDAVAVIPWTTYKFNGDRRILAENYQGVKAWVEYMRSHAHNNLYIWSNPDSTWFGYGDWIAPVKSPAKPISVSYYFYSTKILSQMAEILGYDKDAAEYSRLANEIAKAYQKTYFDEQTQNYEGNTQTANLLPLAFGITPKDLEETVARNVANDVIAKGIHPSTGFLGTGYILQMLSEHGYHELAWKMVRQTTYPSWGYMVENGATTIWELWDSNKQPPDKMNSRNHFALGCIGDWFFAYLAGIRPDVEQPGFKRSVIAPRPAEGLDWAKASLNTHYGRLSSSWKYEGGVFTLEVEIPANTISVVRIPVRGMGKFSVHANGKVIYDDSKAVDNPMGIVLSAERKDALSFEVPSGTYTFVVK
jgi:alpha-L-rhamnosidase